MTLRRQCTALHGQREALHRQRETAGTDQLPWRNNRSGTLRSGVRRLMGSPDASGQGKAER
jgi:hypothetical protein